MKQNTQRKRVCQLQEASNSFRGTRQIFFKENQTAFQALPLELQQGVPQRQIRSTIEINQQMGPNMPFMVFTFGLLKEIFQIEENSQQKLEKLYQIIDDDEMPMALFEEDGIYIDFSVSKMKRLLADYLKEMQNGGMSVEESLKKYPVVFCIMNVFMKSLLIKTNYCQPIGDLELSEVNEILGGVFEMAIITGENCLKFCETNTLVYLSKETEGSEQSQKVFLLSLRGSPPIEAVNSSQLLSNSEIGASDKNYLEEEFLDAFQVSQKTTESEVIVSTINLEDSCQLQSETPTQELISGQQTDPDVALPKVNLQTPDFILDSENDQLGTLDGQKTRRNPRASKTTFQMNGQEQGSRREVKFTQSNTQDKGSAEKCLLPAESEGRFLERSKVSKLSKLSEIAASQRFTTQKSIYESGDEPNTSNEYSYLDSSTSAILVSSTKPQDLLATGGKATRFSQLFQNGSSLEGFAHEKKSACHQKNLSCFTASGFKKSDCENGANSLSFNRRSSSNVCSFSKVRKKRMNSQLSNPNQSRNKHPVESIKEVQEEHKDSHKTSIIQLKECESIRVDEESSLEQRKEDGFQQQSSKSAILEDDSHLKVQLKSTADTEGNFKKVKNGAHHTKLEPSQTPNQQKQCDGDQQTERVREGNRKFILNKSNKKSTMLTSSSTVRVEKAPSSSKGLVANVYSKHGYVNNNISKQFTDSFILNQMNQDAQENIRGLKEHAREERAAIKAHIREQTVGAATYRG